MKRRLFEPADQDPLSRNAIIGGPWASDVMYVMGYCDAADALIGHALNQGGQDALFYPVCFLYRHAIELALKDLVRDGDRLARLLVAHGELDESRADQISKRVTRLSSTHRLATLVTYVVEVQQAAGVEKIPSSVLRTLRLLDEIDQSGQAFRYPVSNAGTPWFTDQQQVDFVRLGSELSEAVKVLVNGFGSVIHARIEAANEMMDEFGP